MDLDMKRLTLEVPGEAGPRLLQCKLLEPGQDEENQSLSMSELYSVFCTDKEEDKNCAENGESDEEASGPEEDDTAAAIEGVNVLPPDPKQMGDGNLVLSDKQDVFQEEGTVVVPVLHVGEDPPWAPHDQYSDEEVVEHKESSKDPWAAFSGLGLPGSGSSSSKGLPEENPAGLNVTDPSVRESVPPGAKIQHRRGKDEFHASGFQVWPSNHASSRFFSYGGGGKYPSREAAMHAAIHHCWENS